MQFVILCSSRGTTFQSVIDSLQDGSLTAQCLGLVTDQEDRRCVERAEKAGIPYQVVTADPKADRDIFVTEVDHAIRNLGGDESTIIALMGWMWILPPSFIAQWKNRILNVHPALLPKFGGKGMYASHVHDAVLAAKEKESGITIHLVDEGIDTGQILLQKKFMITPGDTVNDLRDRAQSLEREWYPKVLQMIHTQEIALP